MSSFTDTKLKYRYIGKNAKRRKMFEVLTPFEYKVGPYDEPFFTVEIPKGFRTDFASIPWPLNKIIKQDGPYAKAACVHDKLLIHIKKYSDTGNYPYLTRLIADAIFYEAMLVSGVPRYIAWPFYTAVRLFSIFGYGYGLKKGG